MKRLGWVAAAGLVLLGLAPVILSALARGVAALGGCALPGACPIFGSDLGPVLAALAALQPLILMTVPFCTCGLVLAIWLMPDRSGG